MKQLIKIEDFIEKLNNLDLKKNTKIKFLDKIYLYDYPNLTGIYEMGKSTKKEYSLFAQLDITNLHCLIEIIEEDEDEDINIQSYQELLIDQLTERKYTNADIYILGTQINALTRAVKKLDKEINRYE